MTHVNDDQNRDPAEIPTDEARQARRGRPVLYILIGGLGGAIVALGVVYAYFA